jgi:hypothetical protein
MKIETVAIESTIEASVYVVDEARGKTLFAAALQGEELALKLYAAIRDYLSRVVLFECALCNQRIGKPTFLIMLTTDRGEWTTCICADCTQRSDLGTRLQASAQALFSTTSDPSPTRH